MAYSGPPSNQDIRTDSSFEADIKFPHIIKPSSSEEQGKPVSLSKQSYPNDEDLVKSPDSLLEHHHLSENQPPGSNSYPGSFFLNRGPGSIINSSIFWEDQEPAPSRSNLYLSENQPPGSYVYLSENRPPGSYVYLSENRPPGSIIYSLNSSEMGTYGYQDTAPTISGLSKYKKMLDQDRWVWVDPAKQENIISCCIDAIDILQHPTHHHDLLLTHVLHNNTPTFDRNCNGCLEKLTSSADPHYYYCAQCDYSLHKICATLTETKHHPLDTKHQLTLYAEPPHEFGQGKCSCCKETWSNFTYSCSECKLDIDVKCATVGEHKVKHWLHDHHVTLVSGEISMNCAFCGLNHTGSFFHCTTCEKANSYIHSQCAQYPIRLPFQCIDGPEHDHPLQLALESDASCGLCKNRIQKGLRSTCTDTKCPYTQHIKCQTTTTQGTPHEHKLKDSQESVISCNICEKDILKGSPRYTCTKTCPYSVHTTCAIPQPMAINEVSYADYENNTERVPNLPFPDNSYSLVKHYFSKWEKEEGSSPAFNLLIHDHPLLLVNQAEDMTEDLEKLKQKLKLICKLCGQLITEDSFYRCPEECCSNFLLHKWCAKLPTMLEKSPCHTNHPLFLQPKYSQLYGSLGLFKCDVCGLWCDGFSYGCHKCDFHVDINCAFLLKDIKHKKHQLHTLRLSPFWTQKRLMKCAACSVALYDGVFVYQCFKCNFFIHTECSLLPREIRHRYDEHNYKLTFSLLPSDDKYFCDICEQQIDTKQWFYHCEECDQSAHASFAACIKPYNKVLRLISIGNHPHGFSLVATREEVTCKVCDKVVVTLPFFKCSTCEYSVDSWCVPKMIRDSVEDELKSQIDNLHLNNE